MVEPIETAESKAKKIKDYNRKKNKAKAEAEKRKLLAEESGVPATEQEEEKIVKKKKKEKKPKDKTLEAFNNLKKIRKESDDDEKDDAEPVQAKKKKVKKVKKADHIHETKGQNRALKYLESWNAFQNGENPDWKFQKVPQIWLLSNVYNSDKVPDKRFDNLLKYMDSIKGQMRKKAIGMYIF